MRTAAQVISIVLHPLLMATYAGLSYFFLLPSLRELSGGNHTWVILGLLFISTFALPLLSVLIMLRLGKISNLFMDDRRERNWPLLQTAIVYAGAFFAMKAKSVPSFVPLFILGAMSTMIIAMLINLKWKISLHMIGIGGLCGAITALFILLREGSPVHLAGFFILAGILGTARLLTESHSPLQILSGFILGFASEFLLMVFVAG